MKGERQPLLVSIDNSVNDNVHSHKRGNDYYQSVATAIAIVLIVFVGLASASYYINSHAVMNASSTAVEVPSTTSTSSMIPNVINTINPEANISESANKHKPIEVVFVLGGPGAGKGTQCENIVRYYKWMHLSMGDLLRAERTKGGALGDVIDDAMKNGKLVPGEITVELLKKEMAHQQSLGVHRFLIDGFPRNRENIVDWEKLIGPIDRNNKTQGAHSVRKFAKVRFALFFDCPEKTMLERCLHRGETSGRIDDNEESVKKRFVTYREETEPIIDAFDQLGIVKTISAVPPAEEVFETIRVLFAGTERDVPLPPLQPTPPLLSASAWNYQPATHRVYGCPNPNL